MNSSELIKKRLVQLKKMSVQLKESTQNHNQVDYNLIQGILSATKSSALSDNNNDQMYFSKSERKYEKQSPLTKLLSFTATHNPRDNTNLGQQYTSLFPQNSHYTKKQSKRALFESKSNNSVHHKPFQQSGIHSHQTYFSKQQNNPNFNYKNQHFNNSYNNDNQEQTHAFNTHSNEQQMISLRQQNTQLQKKLMSLRKQVDSLKEKNQRLQEQTWKEGLPFFKLKQKIQGFYTKLRVSDKDYQKIDYISYQFDLTLDKLLINKSTGSSSPKQLYLASLLQVHYIQSTIMLLQFGQINNEQENQNLFIKFQNQQDLHRWDIAFYINFQIIDSLKKQKLFSMSSYNINLKGKQRKKSSQSRKRSSDSHKKSFDTQYKDQKDLINKLVQTRDKYLQTKKIVNQKMIQKINAKKGKKQQLNEKDQVDQQSQTTPYQIKEDPLNKQLFSVFLDPKQDDYQEKQGQKQKRSNTSKFKQLQQIPPLSLGSKDLSFNQNNFQLNLSKKLQQDQEKQKRSEELLKLQKQKEQKKKFDQILNRMTKIGFFLTKYSKDGFNPHNKKVFVSQNLQNLCWEQQTGGDLKTISLQNIKQVIYQKIGEGVRKHVKKPKKQEYCMINYITNDKKNKVIQLGGKVDEVSKFVDQLIFLMEHKNNGKNTK